MNAPPEMKVPQPVGTGERHGVDLTAEGNASVTPGWYRPRFMVRDTERRPRDRQRKKAYRFEKDNLRALWPLWLESLPDALALPQAVELVWNAERARYGLKSVPPPEVRVDPKLRAFAACYSATAVHEPRQALRRIGRGRFAVNQERVVVPHRITFGDLRDPHGWDSHCFGAVLHEVAHGLTTSLERIEREAHGPEFVGLLIGLYSRHAGVEYCVGRLVQQARVDYRLRVDERWIEGKP